MGFSNRSHYSYFVSMVKILQSRIFRTTLSKCFALLSQSDRNKLGLMGGLQLVLSLLDLIGVALIGLVATIAVNGIGSKGPGDGIDKILEFAGISNYSLQFQAAIIGILAVLVLVIRTVLSVIFMRKTLFFLSTRGAAISSELYSKIISQSLQGLQSRGTQEYVYSVTFGVEVITLRILAPLVSLVSDIFLMLVMSVGLMLVDPIMAISAILMLSTVSFILFRTMHRRAEKLGLLNSQVDVQSRENVVESIASFREISVKNRQSFYARNFAESRYRIADILAENNFMPYVSKYVIESTVVLAALFIAAAQFLLSDAVHAVSTLTVFLAAGTRIAPAFLRLQQGAIQINSGLGSANSTLNMISDLRNTQGTSVKSQPFSTIHSGFIPSIEANNVSLQYVGSEVLALDDVTFSISEGEMLAVVGPSGAGKTSIIDVLLGVIAPTKGSIHVSGLRPDETVQQWPGAIAYVPQDISIVRGTIASNVALGFDLSEVEESRIWQALEIAQLKTFVEGLEDGIQSLVGERGSKLSGGQRQRLGIARALLSSPKLLVLDEATSALDGKSEIDLSDAISNLKNSMTLVVIAHRLSTVRNADLVIYMDAGRIRASGTFDEVRDLVPDFDQQAKLMGL